jgi:hypothetical protein
MTGVVIGSVAGLLLINYSNNKRQGYGETPKRH